MPLKSGLALAQIGFNAQMNLSAGNIVSVDGQHSKGELMKLSKVFFYATTLAAAVSVAHEPTATYNESAYPKTIQEISSNSVSANGINSDDAESPIYLTKQDRNKKVATAFGAGFTSRSTASTAAPFKNGSVHPGMAPGAALTEDQAAEMLKTANDAEIDAAKLAKRRASNDHVKEYAVMMVEDHKRSNREGRKLLSKLDVGTDESSASQNLKSEANVKIDELKKLKGSEFDRAYITSQIEMHRMLLSDIDQKLIPAVSKPELKDFLRNTRAHVQQHLTRAQEIESTLQ